MPSTKSVRWFFVSLAFALALAVLAAGPHGNSAAEKESGAAVAKSGGRAKMAVREKILFRFEIADLVTNHQLEGQRNTFHVEYEYGGQLKGGSYDLQGHAVPADTYPYFQAVRQDMIRYITEYADKKDFYELYGTNICRFVLEKYPQIRRIRLTIDIPAYKAIDVDRSEEIEVVREQAAP